jgi:hypothetical protein
MVQANEILIGEGLNFTQKAGCLFIGEITEVREKAIKVNYGWSHDIYGVIVYNYTTWIPISVLQKEKYGLTVKKWFARNGLKKDSCFNIKPYYYHENKKCNY